MALTSQGTTVTWGAFTLAGITSVSVDGVTADIVEVSPRSSVSRYKVYSDADYDYGTVSISLFDSSGIGTGHVGTNYALAITSAGASFSFSYAYLQDYKWSATVGDVQKVQLTFKCGA